MSSSGVFLGKCVIVNSGWLSRMLILLWSLGYQKGVNLCESAYMFLHWFKDVSTYTHLYIYNTHTHTHTYIYILIWVDICSFKLVQTCRVYAHILIYISIFIYTHALTYEVVKELKLTSVKHYHICWCENSRTNLSALSTCSMWLV